MPHLQAMAELANAAWSRERIDEIDAGLFEPGKNLVEAAVAVGVCATPSAQEVLGSFPDGEQEAIRAAIFSALSRSPRLPITFAWAPGYYFEVLISEVAGTPTNRGGMTIFLRSRFPDDNTPLPASS